MKTFYVKTDPKSDGEMMDVSKIIFDNSIPLKDENALQELVNQIGDAKYVLLGEASHGTHEYYKWRTKLSKLLIEKKGFSFIAVEGDWPDCYRLNRYIKNYPDSGKSAHEVLHGFNRWPTWMWANWEIVALAEWLYDYNVKQEEEQKIGFYGLDVYSLWESLEAIVDYLDKNDFATKEVAMKAIKCFEPFKDSEGQEYAKFSRIVPSLCENQVVDLLSQIRLNAPNYNNDPETIMSLKQNAQIVVNAEKYYRAMVIGGPDSWNIRDRHMVLTLNNLMEFHGSQAKTIIWEHNTHIGDARATNMAEEGMVNVGQIIRQQHKAEEVFSVGFGSYKGTVVAGREWGDKMQVMTVPEAKENSWEFELHHLDANDRIIFMNDAMKEIIGKKHFDHRAIGVVYRPQFEYYGNYVPSKMAYRYDAFIYLDETSALHPLHIIPDGNQIPETYPFGV
ncbi:erythromycin esterase family protein [Flavobacterium luteum]|nr:erythromycin esterase family protein [Flavobacterium luteum]